MNDRLDALERRIAQLEARLRDTTTALEINARNIEQVKTEAAARLAILDGARNTHMALLIALMATHPDRQALSNLAHHQTNLTHDLLIGQSVPEDTLHAVQAYAAALLAMLPPSAPPPPPHRT